MNRKLGIGIGAILLCVLGVMSVQAVVNIGPDVIVKGTKIEVLGPGPDLQAIIDGITVGANERYLIMLGPGEYTLTTVLTMKDFVSIAGSGQGVTILKGDIGSLGLNQSAAIVWGADNASLTDVTIKNTGGGSSFSLAIYNSSSSPRIERVTATASGAGANYCVYNGASASPTMIQVTATGSGGTISYGVFNNHSSAEPRIEHSSLTGDTAGIRFWPGATDTRVNYTRIVGGVADLTGTQCIGNYDENSTPVAC